MSHCCICPVSGHPVDEDLADLHTNAARAQCILHGFPGADNRDPADFPREGEAMIALTYLTVSAFR